MNQIALLIDDTHPMYNHFKDYLQYVTTIIVNSNDCICHLK